MLQCFGRAVELSPNDGYSKYMNLGQLFEGRHLNINLLKDPLP